MKRFDDIKVGDKAELIHIITQSDFDRFVDLTGDDNKIHVDKEYAKQTSLKKPIVHGMLTASFISTLIGTKLPGNGALWYEQQTRFLKPVYIGEKIRVWGKVKKKQAALRLLVLEVLVYGKDNKKVIECEAKVVYLQSNNSN